MTEAQKHGRFRRKKPKSTRLELRVDWEKPTRIVLLLVIPKAAFKNINGPTPGTVVERMLRDGEVVGSNPASFLPLLCPIGSESFIQVPRSGTSLLIFLYKNILIFS